MTNKINKKKAGGKEYLEEIGKALRTNLNK
jgi:hypothetical protein